MTGIFGDPKRHYAWEVLANTNIDRKSWWNGLFPDTVLSQVVVALECLSITSASNERNWSVRGNIHTKIRNRYDLHDGFLKSDVSKVRIFWRFRY